MVATGITADAPVGTPLVAWLMGLSLLSLLTSLVTLVTLDGARWLDTKVRRCLYVLDTIGPSRTRRALKHYRRSIYVWHETSHRHRHTAVPHLKKYPGYIHKYRAWEVLFGFGMHDRKPKVFVHTSSSGLPAYRVNQDMTTPFPEYRTV